MKKSLLLILIAIFLQLNSYGQRRGNRTITPTEVRGKILDGGSGQALGYATISVFSNRDSSLIGGGISSEDGTFKVDAAGIDFWVEVEFISYKTVKIEEITVDTKSRIADLGVITLVEGGVALEEVEVVAEKSTTQFALDKRVFNVGKDLATRGGNATDILDNVPSVNVDVEGNVTLRGSGGVRILIDGKPSGLVGIGDASGLQNLPAELIEKVEVITNPSARYEAEGSTGIINIVLKQDRKSGFNGSFDFITGHPYKLGAGANLNYRSGRLNYFLNYNIRENTSLGVSERYQENYFEDQTRASFINRDFERSGFANNIRGGLGYSIDDNTIITFSGLYRVSDDSNLGITSYADYFLPAGSRLIDESLLTGADLILRPDDEAEEESNSEFSVNLDKKFGKNHTLKSSLTYRDQTEIESSQLQEFFADANQTPLSDPYLFQRTRNEEGERNWLYFLDYVRPIGETGSFEAGTRISIRDIGNDFLVEEQDDDGVFQSLEDFTNNFIYDEDVYAIYSQYGNKIDKFSYQVGLRGEWSRVKTELENTGEVNDRNYANLFPSVFLNYSFSDTDGVQLSYSRRIRRPRFWSLNPFFGFGDPRNFFGGNPNLDPEFSDNYEFGYLKYWNKASLTSSIYYRHVTDVIERVRFEDPNDPSIIITRPFNLATEDNFGFEFVGSYRPTKWWRMDGNLNLFRSITSGNFGDISLEADTYTWSGRATTRFTFWNKSDLQLRFNYRAGRQTTQGSSQGIGTTDIAFSKDFRGDDFTITLNVRDLFNSRRRVSETFTEDFYTRGFFQWRVRDISLNLTYRLNKKKERSRPQRGGGDFEGGGEF